MDTTKTIAICLAVYFLIPVLMYFLIPKDPVVPARKRAIVLVLGDIGRSPRMQYHVLSLVETGFVVDFVGYTETPPLQAITNSPDVKIYGIKQSNSSFFLKVISLTYQLYYVLKPLKNAEYLLVQNPPAIPTLLVSVIFTTFISRRTRYIIDWHNFGYSVLALKLSPSHLLVRFSEWYEHRLANFAFAHFTVTKIMAEVLVRDFNIPAFRIIPLPDRPARQFQPLSEPEKVDVLASPLFSGFDPAVDKYIVTSTSYTPDEDMSVMLDALSEYDLFSASTPLPKIFALVTGKGPLQSQFLEELAKRKWQNVIVRTAWLPAEQYPRVIAAADIGVSMHYSTSGWDLPMKVVDLFGCGVPALSRSFPAISELVVEGRNGLLFDTAADLARELVNVFTDKDLLLKLRKGAKLECGNRWSENWRITAGPIFHIPNREDLSELGIDSSSSSDDDE